MRATSTHIASLQGLTVRQLRDIAAAREKVGGRALTHIVIPLRIQPRRLAHQTHPRRMALGNQQSILLSQRRQGGFFFLCITGRQGDLRQAGGSKTIQRRQQR